MALDMATYYDEKIHIVLALIEERRLSIIKRVSEGSKNGTNIIGGKPQLTHPDDLAVASAEFDAYLEEEVEVVPHALTLEALVAEITRRPSNAVASADLRAIKPFFAKKDDEKPAPTVAELEKLVADLTIRLGAANAELAEKKAPAEPPSDAGVTNS